MMSIAAQADDAAALIEELGLAPAIVFGTSGGGDIALELVARRPELVRGAIVHEPALIALAGEPEEGDHELQPIVELAAVDPRRAMEAFVRMNTSDAAFEALDPQLRERMLGNGAHFFSNELAAFAGYVPDADRLRANRRARAHARQPARRAAADPGHDAVRGAARTGGGADLGLTTPPTSSSRRRSPRSCGRSCGGSADGTWHVNGVRLYCEEHGSGAPILCIHGAGGTALAWADAVDKLARLGRVIAYDRRGCARSERPEPYERTSVGRARRRRGRAARCPRRGAGGRHRAQLRRHGGDRPRAALSRPRAGAGPARARRAARARARGRRLGGCARRPAPRRWRRRTASTRSPRR